MHFFVVGGSGRTGSIIIDEALSGGHSVTALVRDPMKIPARPRLSLVKGTPTSQKDVLEAFKFQNGKFDTVIVALSAPRQTDSPFSKSISPPRLMADSVQNLTTAMKQFGVKKILVMQAFGVGSSFQNLNFLMRLVIAKTDMSKQFDDHNLVDHEIREAAQDGSFQWTLVRPAMLKGEEYLPVKVLGDDGRGGSFMPQCSRKSVARFIVEECAESSTYDGRTPVICN